MDQLIAWDGTIEEFWKAVEAIRLGQDIESDHAVLCEVLHFATRHVLECPAEVPVDAINIHEF